MSRSRCSRGVHWRRVAPRQGSSLCLPRDVFLACCGPGVPLLSQIREAAACLRALLPLNLPLKSAGRPASAAVPARTKGGAMPRTGFPSFAALGRVFSSSVRGPRGWAEGTAGRRAEPLRAGLERRVGGASTACRTHTHHEARGPRCAFHLYYVYLNYHNLSPSWCLCFLFYYPHDVDTTSFYNAKEILLFSCSRPSNVFPSHLA